MALLNGCRARFTNEQNCILMRRHLVVMISCWNIDVLKKAVINDKVIRNMIPGCPQPEVVRPIAANGRIAVVKVAIINQQVMNSIINKVADDQLEYLASLSSNLPTGEIQVIKSQISALDTGIALRFIYPGCGIG